MGDLTFLSASKVLVSGATVACVTVSKGTSERATAKHERVKKGGREGGREGWNE
jgi:hypothetical protein